jgi:hypothetical protein
MFKGWMRIDENEYLHLEDMSEVRQAVLKVFGTTLTLRAQIPCPEFDLFGLSRFEALNAELNTPELAGIALLGADVPPVPMMLVGEPRRYCLEFDGLWDSASDTSA